MLKSSTRAAAEARQTRVAKVVWGLLFLTMGVLFFLDEAGQVNMRGPETYPGAYAVDGDPKTRWSSGWSDPQSLTVDLGTVADITRVKLLWEAAHAVAYRLEVSSDGTNFTTVQEVKDGDGETDDLEVATSGRYVRMAGTKRSSQYGYSLYEFEVYGPDGLLSFARPVRVTSTETMPLWPLFWSRYWPLFLVGLGLPAVFAPKDGGDQFLGLVFASSGVFFQLQRLGLVQWTFAQAWPILLVVGGALLVVQALRQPQGLPGPEPVPGDGSDPSAPGR